MVSTLVKEAVQNTLEGRGYSSASPLANVLDYIAGQGFEDEQTGDASEWIVWAGFFELDEEDFAYLVEKGIVDAKDQRAWTLTIYDQGFRYASEGREEFDSIDRAYAEDLERNEAIDEAASELRDLEGEETGRCDSCNAANVTAGAFSGRVHEAGCPREARLNNARERLANLEDY